MAQRIRRRVWTLVITGSIVLFGIGTALVAASLSGQVVHVAGTGEFGFSGDGGPAVGAQLALPTAVAVGPDGTIYFADMANNRIRRISPAGIIDTVAGTGELGLPGEGDGGPATSATFSDVMSIALDGARNLLYVAEMTHDRIRRIDLTTGVIETFAIFEDVNGHTVGATGMAVDTAGNLYVSATHACQVVVFRGLGVRERIGGLDHVGPEGCPATTDDVLASNGDGGPALDAPILLPQSMSVDAAGHVYFVERTGSFGAASDRIRRIDTATGIITTIAGGGTLAPGPGVLATEANLGTIVLAIAIDDAPGGATRLFLGGEGFAGTNGGSRIFVLDLGTGTLAMLAGTTEITDTTACDGPPASIVFGGIAVNGLAHGPSGELIVVDHLGHRICAIEPDGTTPTGVSFIDTALTTIMSPPGVTSVAGDVIVTGNHGATVIDLSALESAGGDVIVRDNAGATVVDVSGLDTVGGDMTVESTGTGTFDATACAGGSTSIDATGYATVLATTALGGTTDVTVTNDNAISVAIQQGTFAACVNFSVTRVAFTPETGTGEDGIVGLVDAIDAYAIEFDVPTLGQPAELTFQINMASLTPARQVEILEALNTGLLRLGTRRDGSAVFQLFGICSAGEEPSVNGCVRLETLDAAGNPIPSNVSPAIVRFTGVVGHFSTWAVAIMRPTPVSAARFNGLLQPYPATSQTTTPSFKRGSVVPVKFNWVDAAGLVLDSATANPSISIITGACASQPAATAAVSAEDAGTSGLRYDAAARTWTFGWNTKGLNAGCYWIQVTTGTSTFPGPSGMFPAALRDR